jgi:hypothetical protein
MRFLGNNEPNKRDVRSVRCTRASAWCLAGLLASALMNPVSANAQAVGNTLAPTPSSNPTAGSTGAEPEATAGARPATTSRSSALLEIGLMAALDRARSFYQNGRYDSCVSSYGELFDQGDELSAQVTADVLEQARVHYAACLLAVGNSERADEQFRDALVANPLMAAPDPVLFPGKVRDLFFKVKADFLEEIRRVQDERLEQARLESLARARRAQEERERIQQLEEFAATERVVSVNRRWVSAIPFGVGQFQNNDPVLGTIFLTTELLLAAACLTAVAVELNTHAQADGGRAIYQTAKPYNDRLEIAHTVEIGAGAGLIVTALVGILQAQAAFVPEVPVGTRRRAVPEELVKGRSKTNTTPAPKVQAALDRDRAWLGISGRF